MITYSKIVHFKNWTKTDFTYKYDNQEQTFKTGVLYSLPAEIAQHFAHHLAVRECFARKLEFLPEETMKDFMEKCFPQGVINEVKKEGLPIEEVPQDAKGDVPVVKETVIDNKKLRTKKAIKTTKDSEYVNPHAETV